MDTSFIAEMEQTQPVRLWWLLLLTGIGLFVLGIIVLWFPLQSYEGMSMLFGYAILFAGLFQIILSASNNHYMTSRGWMWVSGIIELILGFILVFNPILSAEILPVVLGFWLLFRGFSAIGLSSDLSTMGVSGSGWTLFFGFLLLIAAIWLLFQPLVLGTAAVILWVGISLLCAGLFTFVYSLQLGSIHRSMPRKAEQKAHGVDGAE
ncbi:MAG: DUF308 domain-containing protein [Alistipes sp.]|nr:DUF308 domain-containing protein [Alistipes sp.]